MKTMEKIEQMCMSKIERAFNENEEILKKIIKKIANCEKCRGTLTESYDLINEVQATLTVYKSCLEMKKRWQT